MWQHLRLGPMTTGARRGLLYLVILTALLVAGAYVLAARGVNEVRVQQHMLKVQQDRLRVQQQRLRMEQHAACKFYDDLGSAPVASSPATGKPSLLGVTIVSDARVAWTGDGCPGQLAAADPSFTMWAARYGLPQQ